SAARGGWRGASPRRPPYAPRRLVATPSEIAIGGIIVAENAIAGRHGHSAARAHQVGGAGAARGAAARGVGGFVGDASMVFGGLFASYVVYRALYPMAFAVASQELDITLGTINTAVLLVSSFTMVVAVFGSQTGSRRMLVGGLALTIALGIVFLAIKVYEY